MVSTKNGDGLNCRATNLKLIDISERQKTIFKKHRGESSFKYLSASDRKKIAKQNTSRMHAVKQYSIDSKLLNEFKSITLAAQKTGTDLTNICQSAGKKKKSKLAGGFVWRYGDDHYNGEYLNIPRYKKIVQYSLAGQEIKIYSNITEAAAATGANENYIRKVVRGKGKSAGGFIWRYEGDDYNG